MERGTEVTVIAYKGVRLRRRVWEDTGPGLLLCSEQEYQRARHLGDEARAAGFPKEDVVEVHGRAGVRGDEHDRREAR